MAKSKTERGRLSSRKKVEVVLRVLLGEDRDLVSREAGITAATLSEWRDHFVTSGQAGLKSRAADGRDAELARLKALVGDLTMRLELSREAVQRLQVASLWPPGGRRDEPRPVAFPAALLGRGASLSGMGRAPVDVLSPPAPRRGAARRAYQAWPEDGVHRRGAHRAHPAGARGLALLRRRAPQSLGALAGARDSHLEASRAATHAAGWPLGAQPDPARLGTPGPRRQDHDRAPESDVGHRCDQHGDAAGRARQVFVGVDHCTLEGIGIHAARRATRFEALEPIRQGVRQQFGTFAAGSATGVQVRHDHGSQSMSEDFQTELRFLGMTSSPAFVRAPEGNGVAERFIRTLKEQRLWVHTFPTVEDLRRALHDWLRLYNEPWLVERHRFRSPAQVRRDLLATPEAA